MAPTIFNYKNYRFFFFSREELRIHIHITNHEGEAKFWIRPVVALANHYGFTSKQLRELQKVVEAHSDEITRAWKKHFKS